MSHYDHSQRDDGAGAALLIAVFILALAFGVIIGIPYGIIQIVHVLAA